MPNQRTLGFTVQMLYYLFDACCVCFAGQVVPARRTVAATRNWRLLVIIETMEWRKYEIKIEE
nr:hypothetical protein Iba_chr10bCG5910 [Ipomoea batatas]